MNDFVIDSNVFLSGFIPKEDFHKPSLGLIKYLEEAGATIFLPRISWSEISTRIYLKTSQHERMIGVQREIENMPGLEIVELDESIWLTAEMIQYHCKLKTSDLLVAATAYEKEAVLITWDKQLIKQASKVIDAMTPKEFLKAA